MRVHFKKTGRRRYGVFVERDRAPDLLMHPAPGFDDQLPHDLLHFVAEAEWGIDESVFGQLAAGGDAGTFWAPEKLANKWARRGAELRKRGSGKRSEQLAGLLDVAWHARAAGRAYDVPVDDRERFERVLVSLDELARRWEALPVGGVLTLEWPRPEGRTLRRKPSSASRAARRDAAGTRARSAGRARA